MNKVSRPRYCKKFAENLEATYFQIDDWNAVTKGLTRDETWKINEAFLSQQVQQGKQILFSHNPNKAESGTFFIKEVAFLRRMGYEFRLTKQGVWEAY